MTLYNIIMCRLRNKIGIRLSALFIGVLSVVLCGSCSKESSDNTNVRKTRRTLLVYMVAENSLARYAMTDESEMLLGTRYMKDNDNVVVFIDDRAKPRIYNLNNKISQTVTTFSGIKPVLEYDTDFNSAAASSLDAFLRYAMDKYPSDEYALVLWSHASGWINSTFAEDTKAATAPMRSFGIDNQLNTERDIGHQMNIPDLAEVLKRYPKFDFLMFDACFMQTIEVAYELRDCAKYIIGSPAEIPADGAPYTQILKSFFSETLDAQAVTRAYYDVYSTSTAGLLISCLKCDELQPFADYMLKLMPICHNSLMTANYSSVQDYFFYDSWRSDKVVMTDMYDMLSVMQNVLTEDELAQWRLHFDRLVPLALSTGSWYSIYNKRKNTVKSGQYGGISMLVPLEKYNIRDVKLIQDFYTIMEWGKTIWLPFKN